MNDEMIHKGIEESAAINRGEIKPLQNCPAFVDENYTSMSPELLRLNKKVAEHYQLGTVRPNSDRAINEAREENLDVVYPEANQLQIDVDTQEGEDIFWAVAPILNQYYGPCMVKVTPSRSGGENKHIAVTMSREVTNFERIALQACLGSDRIREILGVVQEMFYDPHPTLFLEKKPDIELPSAELIGE